VGPAQFNFFCNIQTQQKLVNSKWKPSHAPKTLKCCMMLDWKIINNFFNCTDFKLPIEINLKNPGIDSIFEYSMNFKEIQTFWEKSKKFSKILS
jgi:hypothetical protein